MGFLSRFEGKVEDTFDNAADKLVGSPLSPVQIAKKAEKQMRRNKMVGAGKQYAPTLYTVLVNPDDDARLFGYYPTLAGETETYLAAKAAQDGLVMDGQPLVRFIVDDGLRHGKFDVVAEPVAAPLIAQLREEEMQRYGLAAPANRAYGAQPMPAAAPYAAPARGGAAQPASNGYDSYDDGYGSYYDEAPNDGGEWGDGYGDEQGQNADADFAGFDVYNEEGFYDDAPAGAQGDWNNAPSAAAAQAQAESAPAAANTVVFAGNAAALVKAGAGSPAVTPARLIDPASGRSWTLGAPRLLLGRETSCNIVIPDINASRTHAELRFEQAQGWTITDLGSTNGTFVNGREVSSQPLRGGERIVVGTTNLQFVQG